MSIRNKVLISIAFGLIISLASLMLYYYFEARTQFILQQDEVTTDLITDVNDFTIVVNEFILDPYGSSNVEWLTRYETVVADLKSLQPTDEVTQVILDGVFVLMGDLQVTFSELVLFSRYSEVETLDYGEVDPVAAVANIQLLSSRLLSEISDLKTRYNFQVTQAITVQTYVFFLMLLALIATGALISGFISLRSINRLGVLSKSMSSSAIGKTIFHLNVDSKNEKDEIVVLTRSINKMLEKIKDYQVNLEKRVQERTRELKKANLRNESILTNIGEGLVFTDKKRRVVLANDMAKQLLGREGESIKGKLWDELVQPHDPNKQAIPKSKTLLTKLLKRKSAKPITTNLAEYEYFVRKDGSFFPVILTLSKVISNRKVAGAVIVFSDVTKSLALDRSKSEFVSLASHQLRTPLTGIRWNTELILSGELGKVPKAVRENIEQIYDGNHRMIKLVNSLLNVSRIEMGTFESKPERVNVKEMLDQVVEVHQPFIKKNKLKLTTKINKSLASILIDPNILEQTLSNLLHNAISYSEPTHELLLELKLEPKTKELLIHMKDSGIGMSPEEQEKLFTKFFRGVKAQTLSTDGNGLGLYMVRAMAEKIGGEVSFSSKEGKGSSFYVKLPYQKVKVDRTAKKIPVNA
jgi:PAS domain S-box-containing protein